ncbi:DUF6093 family protein [Sediminivirga luteola]|uniref:Uncharacterized protein n=1 Tax=Sediminivirga luteola TaxID=1774748 RepID=A0A8J2TX58_9MICO|nr:DUF6093 family protein [Sediminivirga luteola]GGA10675.1 hypothetical protein GCM10011333_11870 [Sediminivirga luteola]
MPFPNHKVVPDGWSQHHTQTAEAWFTARCRITTQPDWPEVPDYDNPPEGELLYTGPCSVQPINTATSNEVVAETRTVRPYLVSLPLTVQRVRAEAESPLVRITECPDDPAFVGRQLKVTDVQYASTNWTRDLVCIDNLNQEA